MTSPTTPMLLAISGFEPEKYSTNQLIISRGWCASSDGNYFAQLTSEIMINLLSTGLNGLDTGVITNGYDYFVYIVKNETTGEVGAVASHAKFYGDVVVPSGFTLYRKLRFGFVYNSSRDGIPDYHLSAWPMPIIRLTDAETSGLYSVLGNGASSAWTDVNLSGFLPDNARMAYVQCVTTSQGTAGSAYLRSFGGQNTGIIVGSSTPNDVGDRMCLTIRVTSDLKLQYKVIGGARLNIYVLAKGILICLLKKNCNKELILLPHKWLKCVANMLSLKDIWANAVTGFCN
jgi:hypothetical protein